MTNILIPSTGISEFFKDSYYPKILVEINGKPMIQWVIEEYKPIMDSHYIFVLREDECRRFHTDNIVKLLTDGNCDVITIKENTMGALCTSLFAIEHINNDDRLIIANNDEVRDINYLDLLSFFKEEDVDAGMISFENYHPRWTYIRTEGQDVIEVAEKKPISKNAVTGFFYFKQGKDFVAASKEEIRKGNTVNNAFYISGSINELILKGKKIRHYPMHTKGYHTFYSYERIKLYERWVKENEISKNR